MWALIYAILGFVYLLIFYAVLIFRVGIEENILFHAFMIFNILVSFCIYFYHDFRKESHKNKWYKFVFGNLLTFAFFWAVFFLIAIYLLHGM